MYIRSKSVLIALKKIILRIGIVLGKEMGYDKLGIDLRGKYNMGY